MCCGKNVITLIFVHLAILSGCSNKKETKPQGSKAETTSIPRADLVQIDLKFDVQNPDALPTEKRDLLTKINGSQPVSFSKMTDLFSQDHLDAYNTKKASSMSKIKMDEILLSISKLKTEDLSKFKQDFEAEIANLPPVTEISYNGEAVSLVDFVIDRRMQCYSGTAFFHVALRNTLGAAKFDERHLVVIFEEGHVLPGYMEKGADGAWHMTGIETTTSGPSRVQYGKASALGDLGKPIRIVDGNLFIAIELFKGPGLKNSEEVIDRALKITREKYGIPLAELEAQVVSKMGKGGTDVNPALNASPFAFGKAVVPMVDTPRSVLEVTTAGAIRPMNGAQLSTSPPDLRLREPIRHLEPANRIPVEVPMETTTPTHLHYPESFQSFRVWGTEESHAGGPRFGILVETTKDPGKAVLFLFVPRNVLAYPLNILGQSMMGFPTSDETRGPFKINELSYAIESEVKKSSEEPEREPRELIIETDLILLYGYNFGEGRFRRFQEGAEAWESLQFKSEALFGNQIFLERLPKLVEEVLHEAKSFNREGQGATKQNPEKK